jgi:hypothetical protein
MIDEMYREKGWSDQGSTSEFSQIKEWADRAFE